MNKEKKDKRLMVAIYCRVGSPHQLDQWAMDSQESRLQDYANEHGYQVVYSFKEGGSGLSLDRPQLNKIKGMDQNTIDRLLVTDISRIGRNWMDVHGFTQALKAKGIEIEAINGSHCDSLGFLDDLFKSALKEAKHKRTKKDTISKDTVSGKKSNAVNHAVKRG